MATEITFYAISNSRQDYSHTVISNGRQAGEIFLEKFAGLKFLVADSSK